MIETIPRIADISSLKGVSSLLTLPLICVAYTFQTGAVISWEDDIWFSVGSHSEQVQLNRLILVFILKSLWISFWSIMLYFILAEVHYKSNLPFLQLVSVILIAFSLFGIFGANEHPQLENINELWFYSFIVWGVFLQTMVEQLDKSIK